MKNKRTITTREQVMVNGKICERIATHIVTGAHGYETLCVTGYTKDTNDTGEVIHNSEKLAENQLPITCPVCYTVWHDTHHFSRADFGREPGKSKFIGTNLKEISI